MRSCGRRWYRSPERGRTSTRHADIVSRTTDARTSTVGSTSMYRSTSASVLSTAPRRTVSRSPQRPFVPASMSEQERQLKHDAFIKRMTYDPRAAAAAARRPAAGSTERLSTASANRRSSHGNVSGIVSDGEPFDGCSSAAVANYSSSMASGINAMAQMVESGCSVDDDDVDAPMEMVRLYRATHLQRIMHA